MRKQLFILGLGLVLAANGFSQQSYLGLSFGASFPGKEFANKNVAEGGGYAQTGFDIEFSGAYIFDYYFGVAATVNFSSIPPDRYAYGQDLIEQFPEPLPPDTEIDIKMGNWMYTNLMVGPLVTLPVWKLNFDLRAVAGLNFFLSPPQEINIVAPDDSYFERRSGTTVNFAYMLGAGIRFNVNEAYAIRLSTDYFHATPSFQVEENSLAGSVTGETKYDMKVSTLNLNLGIAYRF